MLFINYHNIILIFVVAFGLFSTNSNVNGFILSRSWMQSTSPSHLISSTTISTTITSSYPSMDSSLASQPKKKRRRKRPEEDESKVTSKVIEDGTSTTAKTDVVIEKSDDFEEEEEEEEKYHEKKDQDSKEESTELRENKAPVFKFDREEALAFGKLQCKFSFLHQMVSLFSFICT